MPLDCRFPLMDPSPNREPPDRLIPPEADRVPSSVMLPDVCVNLAGPPTVKLLPVPVEKIPAFAKLPTVLKRRPLRRLKLPVEALVAKFARPSALLVELRSFDDFPLRVIFAAFVT